MPTACPSCGARCAAQHAGTYSGRKPADRFFESFLKRKLGFVSQAGLSQLKRGERIAHVSGPWGRVRRRNLDADELLDHPPELIHRIPIPTANVERLSTHI